eukprot:3089389-Amphidinium_carterae.1
MSWTMLRFDSTVPHAVRQLNLGGWKTLLESPLLLKRADDEGPIQLSIALGLCRGLKGRSDGEFLCPHHSQARMGAYSELIHHNELADPTDLTSSQT